MMEEKQFQEAKELAQRYEPIIKRVKLSDIEIREDSIKNEYVLVKGNQVPVTKGFFNNLGTHLKVSKGMTAELNNGDQRFHASLIDAVKTYKQNGKNDEVVLLGDASSKCVVGVFKDYNRVSNATLFDLAEQIRRDHGLTVHGVSGGGNPVIMLTSPVATNFAGMKTGEDETFNFGIALGNQGPHTSLGDFNLRLVCDNGMMRVDSKFHHKLKGTGQEDIYRFFRHISDYAAKNFVPETFAHNLEIASKTYASLAEVEDAYSKVEAMVDEQDEMLKCAYKKSLLEKWFWGIPETLDRIKKKGLDPMQLTTEQRRYVKTPQPVWDVVNALTNLGSNIHAEPLSDKSKLIKFGGALFAKTYDLEHASLLSI